MCVAGPDAIVGRSAYAQVRVDDARVSTVHAELSWRSEGFVLLARGGRIATGGRAARSLVLRPGMEIALAPAVLLRVVAVDGGDAPVVPPTAGRDRLRFVVGPDDVKLGTVHGDEPLAQLVGVAGRIVAELLRRRGAGVAWDVVAEAVWPEEGAVRARTREAGDGGWTETDERRLRNRWDQQLVGLRRVLDPIRDGDLLAVRRGVVELRLAPGDVVVEA